MMRVKQLQDHLQEHELDGCILDSDDPNFYYYLQKHVRDGTLFIPATGMPTVFIHYLEELDHEFGVVKLREDELNDYLQDQNAIGYNKPQTTLTEYERWSQHANMTDIHDTLTTLRQVKTGDEIQYLRQAANHADEVIQAILHDFAYDTEGAVRRAINVEIAQQGLKPSFDPVVAFHESASIPHYHGNKPLGEGFLLIDLGVRYKGYCSDITRTVYLGEPSDEEQHVYETVKNVQQTCMSMVKPGTHCNKVYQRAKDELQDKLKHNVGHGIGVEIHEKPAVKQENDDVLKEGMVITIEPGWYDSFGIRIEDMLLITENGNERLTQTSRRLR